MTRDEAAEVLAKIADFAEVIPGGLEIHRSEKCVAIDALRVAITALRAEEHDRVKHGLANQCVACGAEMPEGDQVCKLCREGEK